MPYQCTKMYPVALVCLSPLSGSSVASFPQELSPPVPKPIMELWVKQSFCWLTMMPILALKIARLSPTISNPSLLQIRCKEACEPATFFQVSRSSKMARYFPSAINEYKESAVLLMKIKLTYGPIIISRQIREGCFPVVGNFVSCKSKPFLPAASW